jgi:1-acyl-sn-glycerol-3-phosphate acyltransferase
MVRRTVDHLDFIRFSWTVSGDAIRRDLGFEPELSSEEAVAGPGESEIHDDFGLDAGYIGAWSRTVLLFLHRLYWRVEVEGLEHVPRSGPVVLVGIHRGWVPLDAVLVVYDIFRSRGRIPRFLVHPGLFRFPFSFDFITRFGGILACRENVDRILEGGGMLGVFPEGVRGPFRLYRNAYRVGRFGNDEVLRAALRHGAAVVPFVTVGSAEAFPIVGAIGWRWWRRWTEWPFLPVSPTLVPVPLPSKWHTRFLPPIAEVRDLPPGAASNAETIRSLRRGLREILGREMESIRRARPGIFHGSAFVSVTGEAPEQRGTDS